MYFIFQRIYFDAVCGYSCTKYILWKYRTFLVLKRIFNFIYRGHKLYLASGPNYNFTKFRQLVHDVTQEFKRISEGVIALEAKLRPVNPKLVRVIQHLQVGYWL